MKATASQEMSRTPRTPKCSLMTSVMMKTTGQSITPAVKDSDPLLPNSRQSKGARPSVSSSAKILTPTNSAIRALVTKSPVSATNSRASREAMTTAAMFVGTAPGGPARSVRLMLPPGGDYTRGRTRDRYNPRLVTKGECMDQALLDRLESQTAELAGAGLFKRERVIASPQDPAIRLADGREVPNLCANNYLGLANHPAIVSAAHAALDRYGYGMASVRFICGTQTVHRELERRLSAFLGTEGTILYSSCFDANCGLFETLTGEEYAIISDALNRASIIDGIRASKEKRLRYDNGDLGQLEARLREAEGSRARLVVTDGVFSMDGSIAPLPGICELADRYGATVVVDDSHATGFMGAGGRGTHEHCGVMGRVDVLTGTLGKALGGASGGYVSGRASIVAWLRQRSRPYLFSNSIAPVVAATTLAVLDLLESSAGPREQLAVNAAWFRAQLAAAGFRLLPGEHPIIPVMIGDAALAVRMADRLLELGVYAIGFSYPVVPMGKARIRTQMCASHTRAMLETAAKAFVQAGRELGVTGK